MRYFRCDSGDETYESVRTGLDVEWGHPNDATRTQTCVDPADVAPRDADGRIVLAVADEFAAFPAVAAMLPSLIDAGHVTEIAEPEYMQAVSPPV